MLIATFGPTTSWAGKSIGYDDGRFSHEVEGPISATDVLMYDSQGFLIWAYDGLREWVQQKASPPPAPPVLPPVVTPQPPYRDVFIVPDLFRGRTEFAERIIRTSGMEAVPRKSGYVNLNSSGRTIAQVHPQADGIGLVLRCRGDHLPATLFKELPVASLTGYKGANARWLDGNGPPYETKGPAVAFLIPDEVEDLGDDAREWQDIVKLLEYAKTL